MTGKEYMEQDDDLISRQAVDDAIYDYSRSCDVNYSQIMEYIDKIPPVTPQEPCGDVISRKSIKQKLQEHHDFFVNAYGGFSNLPQNDKSRVDEITNCIAMVVNEPPVTPQELKTGHWIVHPKGIYAHLVCDKCLSNAPYDCRTNYCPNCGARMESEES